MVSGLLVDERRGPWPAVRPGGGGAKDVRAALEAVVLACFRRGQVFVSFSGGRDSSALLAVAAHVARRNGFPDPVALTLHVPHSRHADEDEWQELVLQHLQVEQHRVLVDQQLGMLGPVARACLEQNGLLQPGERLPARPAARDRRGRHRPQRGWR